MALTTETENEIGSKKRQRCQIGMCERAKFSLNNFSVQNDSSKKMKRSATLLPQAMVTMACKRPHTDIASSPSDWDSRSRNHIFHMENVVWLNLY